VGVDETTLLRIAECGNSDPNVTKIHVGLSWIRTDAEFMRHTA